MSYWAQKLAEARNHPRGWSFLKSYWQVLGCLDLPHLS